MSEPLTGTTIVTATLTGMTFASLLSGTDAGVFVGAFAGAVVYVMSDVDLSRVRQIGYFVASFLFGIIAADLSTQIIASLINNYLPQINVGKPIGATVAAALAIRVLLWLTKINLKAALVRVISAISGGGNGNSK